jgi:uncharacterized protein
MRKKLIYDGPQRTFAVVMETGDEVLSSLLAFARGEKLAAAEITGIGALRGAVLGYFDWQKKGYARIPVEEQVEVLSLRETNLVRVSTSFARTVRMWASSKRSTVAPEATG